MIKKIATVFIGVFHVFAFYLEAIIWGEPLSVMVFRIQPQDVETTRLLAANLGCYNLFLGASVLALHFCISENGPFAIQRQATIDFIAFFALAAGLTLLVTAPQLFKGALAQSLPGAIYLAIRIKSVKTSRAKGTS